MRLLSSSTDKFVVLPYAEERLFEVVPARDIDDDLSALLKVLLENRERLGRVGVRQGRLLDQCLTENARRFRERGWRSFLERCSIGQRDIVIGMAEFMSKRGQAGERRCVVLQYPRFVAAQRHTKGAVHLSRARFGIDPVLAEGSLRENSHTR